MARRARRRADGRRSRGADGRHRAGGMERSGAGRRPGGARPRLRAGRPRRHGGRGHRRAPRARVRRPRGLGPGSAGGRARGGRLDRRAAAPRRGVHGGSGRPVGGGAEAQGPALRAAIYHAARSVAELIGMPIAPSSLDHVALWVADRDAIAELLCDHLGMHVIDRTDRFTLVGADAREGKLTLFAADGPREPGALAAVVLRTPSLEDTLAALPPEVGVARENGTAWLTAPEGLRLGLVGGAPAGTDLDHV